MPGTGRLAQRSDRSLPAHGPSPSDCRCGIGRMPPDTHSLLSPSAEHRHIATEQFNRANQVVAAGNYDFGVYLLLNCCKLDPANLVYRQFLRRTQKLKFKNNLRGSWLAGLTNFFPKMR